VRHEVAISIVILEFTRSSCVQPAEANPSRRIYQCAESRQFVSLPDQFLNRGVDQVGEIFSGVRGRAKSGFRQLLSRSVKEE
jgi:hypothetical protein